MKKILIFLVIPFLFFSTLSAQITQEQADQIVIERMSNELQYHSIYAKEDLQTGFEITTSLGETLELDYFCWVYYIDFTLKSNSKYLVVKESNGNLLEINTKNNEAPENLQNWRMLKEPYTLLKTWILIAKETDGVKEALPEDDMYPITLTFTTDNRFYGRHDANVYEGTYSMQADDILLNITMITDVADINWYWSYIDKLSSMGKVVLTNTTMQLSNNQTLIFNFITKEKFEEDYFELPEWYDF